ncbi:hypothetical protein S101446_03397 (plasmid) [Komagataeibacter europaeus]|nr:hypothetical protein S101446_03262 [Komagataeibacter europaeus]ARW18471.1 hypothetical protein S101446_03397 [Komagataeibacter europaeus]
MMGYGRGMLTLWSIGGRSFGRHARVEVLVFRGAFCASINRTEYLFTK